MINLQIAEVILNLPIDNTFYYKIPQNLTGKIETGFRVIVPFKNFKKYALVIKLHKTIPDKSIELKEIISIIEDYPIIDKEILQVFNWISEYYNCSLGEAVASIIGLPTKEKEIWLNTSNNGSKQIIFNNEQKYANDRIENILNGNVQKVFLLHGITGSGKTEIYINAVKKALDMGKNAICLVPEIFLVPQMLNRFLVSFPPEQIAVIHSGISRNEKYGQWNSIIRGEKRIVIGTRSAVLSPMKNMGIIILDEENDSSYKSSTSPRYSARQVAYIRTKMNNAVLLLGSATPSVESYYYAQKGIFELLELKERPGASDNSSIEIVDLNQDEYPISSVMSNSIKDTMGKKEQAIIFLNRRGLAKYLYCGECKYIFNCENCDISLTVHENRKGKTLICHHCGYKQGIPALCPKCEGSNLKEAGFGTQRVEGILKEEFGDYRLLRVDRDSIRVKDYHNVFLGLKEKKIDIMLGTKMISKGLDFENITLVGIILAESSLFIPDFRANENTFELITQVSGRAGRGLKRGKIIIQTFNPDHFSVKTAIENDFHGFYNEEIEQRKRYNYPPFIRILKLTVRGKEEKSVLEDAERLLKELEGDIEDFEIIGPIPAIIYKLNKNFRQQIIIKGQKFNSIMGIIKKYKQKLKGNYIEIDVDPISLL